MVVPCTFASFFEEHRALYIERKKNVNVSTYCFPLNKLIKKENRVKGSVVGYKSGEAIGSI